MGRESRSLILGASSLVCLVIFAFLYSVFFTSSFSQFDSGSSNGIAAEKIDRGGGGGGGGGGGEPLDFLLRRLVRGEARIRLGATGFSCDSDIHSDVCLINKPVRIINQTVYVLSDQSSEQIDHVVQPYPRKDDRNAMTFVSPVQILHGNISTPVCNFSYNVPAMVFSTGGNVGNLFHEFNEIVIPLFITSRHFHSRLQFVITDYKPWMVAKYERVLNHLSAYDAINPVKNGSVHCFPGAVVGLKYHDHLALNASDIPGGYSMSDFKHFLRKAYNLKITNVSEIENPKPVLILISRNRVRMFLNEDEMVGMMEELGFQVIVAPPYKMARIDKFAEVLNSCSVMVGAHGAGLANSVLLPEGAVVVQVVPLGLDYPSTVYFGEPARKMGVHYLEYKIEAEESSLIDQYGRDHPVVADPQSIIFKGYDVVRKIYIEGQNMKMNLVRFRETLVQAKQLLGSSISSNGNEMMV